MAANVLRLEDYGDGLGPLPRIEQDHTAQVFFSEDLSNALWTKTNATVTANAGTAPDGIATADLVTATTAALCQVAQAAGASSISRYLWSVWLKASVGTTASIEINDGTTSWNLDHTFAGSGWERVSVLGGPFVAKPNVIVRPHHKAATPSAGDAVLVWGGQIYVFPSTLPVVHERSYVPRLGSGAVSFGVETWLFTETEWDARMADRPFWFYWIPDFAYPSDFPGDTSFFSLFNGFAGANEILWVKADQKVRMRNGNLSATTYCDTTALTFSAGQVMRVVVDVAGKLRADGRGNVRVLGATTGGEPSLTGAPGRSWPRVPLRVGGRYNDPTSPSAHALQGRVSGPYLIKVPT